MPRIPVYERKVEQGRLPNVTQRVDFTAQDASGGLDKAAGALGDALLKEGQRAKETADQAQLMDAYAQLGNARIDIEREVTALKGKDALGQDLPGVARQKLKAKADEITKGLPSGLAPSFQRIYLQADEGVHRVAADHYARENDAFADVTHGATVQTATSKASDAAVRAAAAPPVEGAGAPPVSVADAPDVVAARKEVLDAAEAKALRKGWKGTPAEAASRAADLSTFHLAVLDRLTDAEQGAAAAAYLERYGSEIDGRERGKSNVDKVVAAAGLKTRGRAEADRLWAAAEGDPAKAVALARGIKDTDLSDEVDRRLKARAAEDHGLQVAADAPREGRLEQGIARYATLDRNSKDYAALSDPGKARIEEKYKAAQRSARATGSEERRQQNETDRYLLALFDGSLPLKGEDGTDQVSIDIDRSDLFATGSPTLREVLKARQKKAQGEWAKDSGVSLQIFTNKISAVSESLGYDPKTTAKDFLTYMREQRDQWHLDNPTAKAMPREVLDKMVGDAILYGDEGGRHFTRNRYAWQNRSKGDPFEAFPEGEQPDKVQGVLRSLRAAPAPKVTRPSRTVDGETRYWDGSTWVKEAE